MNKDYNKVQVKNNMEVGTREQTDSTAVSGEAERPKLQSVVGVAPKKVKRSLFSRLITGLVGPEGMSNIGGYVSEEIVKPAIKNIIFDSLTSGISMALFGDRGGPNRNRHYGTNDYRPRTDYQSRPASRVTNDRGYATRDAPINNEPRSNVITRVSQYGVEDYNIADRHAAAHVLTSLTEHADRYGNVSVADYYDLINVSSVFTDNNYGWRYDTIVAARIVPLRGGWVIRFPAVEVL